ncbi:MULTISPECIES: non-ribosomal peptide synthase/polyketide synthase [Photorhabdus]|uniref:Amino acid adenylation domain-containing protein n=2 Tax=Photorhabdus asymbiotica TaxID=291112 RepID=A0ABX9SJP7_9GAMM|nr:non-ribosomal peptide synthetase [Photorhabdus asymbiotica]RKS54125.1 amino acid adenylation domain-containing protein [Photorhabdus asymbiotica]CAQ85107.1 Similar to proteins involved in antibiotic biosynthesis [Photorhabdus asymbiotica]CAR67551.1 Similar to proteins involved in antibiotic biosynthesis [Photorhabdus asymbiotica subsp. asymbiotica ATCC 43949]
MKDSIANAGNILKAELLSQTSKNIINNVNNIPTSSRPCVVVGGTTLAVFCAEQIQSAGHTIQAVLTNDDVLQTWAIRQGIVCVNSFEALQQQIMLHPVDWLFSIVNPIIPPMSLIEQIRSGAFNYHDSPLPRYAGRHATSWALLARETYYAISWHCIEAGVDTGDIAVQWPVSIEEHDSTFSLNLKCYQAAQEGFIKLLQDLGQGTLITHPQDLTRRSFYAQSCRPDGGGYLCWEQSGEVLSALVRALDFGENYLNLLGCPKVLLKQGTVRISWLQRLNGCSGTAPGTLIDVAEDVWQVTTGSEDVRIGGFTTLEGKVLSAGELAAISELKPGKSLPLLSSPQAQNVKNILQSLAPSESFWCERLASWQPCQLPFEIAGEQLEPRWTMSVWQPPLPKNSETDSLQMLLQTFAIYLARLTHQTKFQIGWYVDEAKDELGILSGLAPVVPMAIEVEFDKPWSVVADWIDNELICLTQHRTFCCDLLSRSPVLSAIPALTTSRPWRIAVSAIKDDRQWEKDALGELLTLQINAQGGFRWIFDANRLSTEDIQRMNEHLQVLASSEKVGDEIPVCQLNLLPEAERTLLLETWNATETIYPDQLCIHQLFEQQVEKTPEATALIAGDKTLSYAELNAGVNRLARQLIAQGISPGDHVAILLERSIELVVAQLAILKVRAVYVPIDPNMPDERKNGLINDCSAKLLLTDELADIPVGLTALLLRISAEVNTHREEETGFNLNLPCRSSDAAYVMYTSGSTGTPKGVIVPHRAVVRLVINNGYAEIGQDDRVAFTANPAFDASTFEIWAPLLNGGALVVIDHATLLTPQVFIQVLQAHRITILWLTVGLFNRLVAELSAALPQIRTLIFGGDIPDRQVIAQVLDKHPPQQLLQAYGPTEGTTFTTMYPIASLPPGMAKVPIGRPIANTRVYLLDGYGQPVPLGGVGEIYVGGAGVACGYLNRPELTAERFLVDPFSDEPNARMYRTGDLARYLVDGNLEFLGRNDQQVKIRGFRIEPGEIEGRLTEYPAIREAVVLVQDDGQDKRLIAYVVAEVDEELVNNLRTYLSTILPDYMVPAAFVRLDAFPLTPNGKLDRRALPAPSKEAFARQIYEAPQGEIEATLAAIWRELLGIEQISRHDNFFALGGHSLFALRMIERLRNLGLTLVARDLFQYPVLSELAHMLGQHQDVVVPPNVITSATAVLTPEMLPLIDLTQSDIDCIVGQVPGGIANIQDIYVLSPLQDGILFHHLLSNDGDPYLLVYMMAFDDRSLLDRYLAAVQQVIDRHDILRTAFLWEGLSVPAQVVWRQALLSVTELMLNPADGPIIDQLTQRFDLRQHYLDLGQAPLLRFMLAQETDGRWIVLQLQHHLTGDHTAMEVMNREVQAYFSGQGDSLPAPMPFRNLVAQARLGVSQEEHIRFFTDMLAGVDEPTLPFGLMEVHRDGSQVTQSHQMLTSTLNDRLRSQARRLGVSLAALCHLAWAQVLSRTSGQQQVVFGTVLFGRMQAGDGADSGMGLFINTLPLRLDMNDTSVRNSVQAAHTRLAALLDHEHASLALAQRCSDVQGETPLFSALLNYRHNDQPMMPGKFVPGIEFLGEQERTNYPFVLSVEDGGSTLGLTAQVVQPFDPERVCGYMQQALESLVEVLEQAPETPIRTLNILPEPEQKLLLKIWNTTESPYPDQLCIHQLFEQQVKKTPEAIALIAGDKVFSYAELNVCANRLARQLIEQGVSLGDNVAILLERSAELVVTQLAIFKVGAVYVPIDPKVPDERKNWLINDCSAKLLFTDEQANIPAGLAVPLFRLSGNIITDREENHFNLDLPGSSTGSAYIMYTSGSTGTPKGVVVPHRAVVRLVINNGYAEIEQDDRVAFTANPAFDASTFEVWAPLLNGGTLVVIDHVTLLTPSDFVRALQVHRITILWMSVGLLNRLVTELSPVLAQIKILIFGGEVLDPYVIAQILDKNPPQQLLQAYGPSEGTTFTTIYPITALPPGVAKIPIGRPIANTRLYLLDAYGQPVPLGATGEIYVGGDGVANGYFNRPELTAERFLTDPFSDVPNARMYRTGDLARYLPDGNLLFVGRNDQQVKIRGFRIEPGEIEARLTEHPAVSEALVLALSDGQDKRLIAYVVAEPGDGLVVSLREHLSTILPDYMVPAAFVRLDAFPLTPNDKRDLRALPAPGEEDFVRQCYEAPQGETEIALAAIWHELLGIGRISRHDNFFALGGHSLLAVRMMNRIAALGIKLPLSTLFEFPSLSTFAEQMSVQLGEVDSILPAIMPISRDSELPLSFAQQRLWFLAQFEGVSDTYHIPIALRLCGQLDIAAWQQALNHLFARHAALRSVFVSVDGQPQVELLPAEFGLPMKKYDLRAVPDADKQLEYLCVQEAEVPFDLTRGPLIRSCLIQLTNDDYVFLLTQHHIVSDGWSLGILKSELGVLYSACLNGQPNPLLPLAIQYPDYAAWQRQWLSAERVQTQSDYWRMMLNDVPILLDLPTDRPRPIQQSFAGHLLPINLDAALTESLQRLSEQQGVTLFMTLLSAWAIVLSRLSGQTDLVIGTPSAGRSRQEVESLIGFFVNTLALRINLSDMPSVTELLARVRQTTLAAQEHQDLPFEQVVEIVQPPRRLAHTPLFQVIFAWQNNEDIDWELPGLTVSPIDPILNTVKFDLELNLSEVDGRIVGYLNYATALFDQQTIERHLGYLHTVLQAMVADSQQPVKKIDILTSAERRLLLEIWNTTKTPYPEQCCIHQLFEQQAEKIPEAMSLIAGDQSLSYAELNVRANQLAHQLIEQGICPDDHVAILLERSVELVVAQLAILKASAIYVPLDPGVPDERKNWLINDCSAKLLLIGARVDVPVGLSVPLFRLSDEVGISKEGSRFNPDLPRSSIGPAYIMYTSGSTGTPKGVIVPHRAVVRLVINNGYADIGRDDRVAFTANPAFDASTFEVWAPLLNGGTLVVIDHAILLTPQEFVRTLQVHQISVLWISVGLLNRLVAELSPVLPQIKILIFGGEVLDPNVISQVLANSPPQQLLQAYGPSEGTTFTTIYHIETLSVGMTRVPIGRPIANTHVYLLDAYGQPVPLGGPGEIYVGGDGVACGYLNRPELTAERFLTDPFNDAPGARMYRTGDLARYLSDGNLVFLGRNDQQVKIRGFRIEPGEIEARLTEYPGVREAVVLVLGDGQDKRLVAYVVADANEELASRLRIHLSKILPDYMVPTAFVRLAVFPLTPNGKLDRRALPAPDEEDLARQRYEAPQGETEIALAVIWRELLGVERISRHDSFFALGGHSLLAVRMIERLRRMGLGVSVQVLFQYPILSILAQFLVQHREIQIPDNRITPDTTALTPEMLPLVDLTQSEINYIVDQVPGGIPNIQDIYALSPLQDGILFHHLLANAGDPYLLASQMAFSDRALLKRYLAAVQQVIDRHDILRTAFLWQGLSVPVQVVWRQAQLSVTELTLDSVDGSVSDQLKRRFDPCQHRLDLSQAPLLRFVVAQETDGRWIVLQLLHHLIGDHTTLEVMNNEVRAYLAGQENSLPAAVPFRNLVAQARLEISHAEHTRFFTDMLAGVNEPTLPFGLAEVHHDGSQMTQSHRMLTPALNARLRSQARRQGVSLAALCHLAWAQVLSRTSGQQQVVFGTVLFGRMRASEGVDSGMGLFINTLPLRLDMDDTSVQDSIQAAHNRLAGLLEHEHASLALAQRCSGVQGEIPLFSSLLNYRHNALSATSNEMMGGIEFLGARERTNYPLVLSVEDFGNALGLTAQIIQPFDPQRICGYMQQALESLAEALEQSPGTPVRALNILPGAEKKLLLETWNATETPYPDQLCIHQLFEQQVAKTPQASALIAKDNILSYAELNARANRLAYQLIEQGILPDDHVAILLERSVELVVAQLAILKVGAVYVPVDPRMPDKRRNWLINDCLAKLLLTDRQVDIPVGLAIPRFYLTDETDTMREEDYLNPDLSCSSVGTAYVMYTSGSTGTPKGVVVPHRAIVRLVINNGYVAIGPDDRVSFTANPAFDASTFEVWAPLLNGGTLVVIDYTTLLTPSKFVRALQDYRITILWISVGLLNRLVAELSPVLPQIKVLIFGGEVLDPNVIAQILDRSPPQQLLQAYGPSEGTTFTTMYRITTLPPGMTRVPIGRPIANTRLYLLDAYGQPVPLGVMGEIYVGGDGIACGYLNRLELTTERFLADPFSDVPGARMYRTGDLARYLPDGNLEFLGRNDQQVKIRGFRIEPGEIEARLTEFPAVREAAVLALGEGLDKRLVAYVVADEDEGLVNCLRTHLSTILPDYMIPAAFVRLDAFPLTSNGKLDSRALPVPDEEAFARQRYEAPQGETEIALAAIWRELLGIERISRHDNFFALGGHSLLAVRMMNRIAALGIELPLTTLFKLPTLMALAEAMIIRCNERDRILSAIVPISRDSELPLSFAQQRLWFLAQFEEVGNTYHIPVVLSLRGQFDIAVWQRALNLLFARHEALRSVFVTVDGHPQIELLPAEFGLPMKKYDLRKVPDVEKQLQYLRMQESETRFNLARGPLIRSALIQLANDDYLFLLTLHHIVFDGWSVSILMRELSALYTAFLTGQPDPLPPLPIQYPDYAAWQRQWLSAERIQNQSDYWRTILADVPVLLDLPTDRPRPVQQSFAGNLLPVSLDAELTQSLKRLSEQQGVTLFMTLLSAWATVLSRLSGQDDLVIGTPSAGRGRQEVESLIGFFVNTLALRIDLSGAPNVIELLARVRQTALAAQEHQDLPFEQVVEIVQPPRRLAHTPLFQVMFAWQNNESTDWKLPGMAVSPAEQFLDIAKFDLELNLSERDGKIVGYLSYATALFDQQTIERHLGYLHTVLQAMVTNPQQRVGKIDILTSAERRLLLEIWNATKVPYPDQLCIHQLFEQQVEKYPDAIAVVHEGQSLTYAELNICANRLAHQLIALGVVPDQRVAICVTRSPATVVGQLAVLKAGGAYVPLDPAYPGERLIHILTDAAPAILLADSAGCDALGEKVLTRLTLLDPNSLLDQPDSNPLVSSLTSRHLAYVIYTSGSTGTPKGVMIEHRGLVNLIQEKIVQFDIHSGSRMLQFASFGFDASVWEVMMALCGGATLDIPVDIVRQEPHHLWHYLEEHTVTHACLTPTMLREGAGLPVMTIKPTLILGGEAPSAALLGALSGRVNLFNAYGPTEITVCATVWYCPPDYTDELISIGRPTANTRIYLLDTYGQPVPLGAVGELYIGGIGVARGYLNHPELTVEHFLTDPFSDDPNARIYRTGDLARYLPDGNLMFVGRNDQQVKIRGFRIEPGEIEARLLEYSAVREALVLASGDGPDKRLIAYVVVPADDGLVNNLRSHLSIILPDYMVPAAFVRLDAFPLTPNGKLDRRALPVPGEEDFARQVYAAPQGEIETILAAIWRKLLGIEQISRHDSFFTLGGHSLLAVRMVERLRNLGLTLAVRDLFQFPVLSELAQTLGQYRAVVVPVNIITPTATQLTPEMLPLIDLTQPEIDCIVGQVPGGMTNIQDIYALSPLQDGILFHHLLANKGDPYLLVSQMAFANRSLLESYLAAVQQMVDRHDILRTAFIWQGVSVPAQVVWRQAPLSVIELTLHPDDGPVRDQLMRRFDTRQHRIDLGQAPLLRFVVAQEEDGRWIVLQLLHHLIGDHTTLGVMNREVQAYLAGQGDNLPAPVPFRNLVAQARLGVSQEKHTHFFTDMLAEVNEPTLPFGLTEVHHDGSQVTESYQLLATELNDRLRGQARRLGVSLASLCHLAWAQVLSRTSGQKQVVFGTVLFGRMQAGEGVDSGMGLFINTLPVRLDIDDTPVRDSVQIVHTRLAGLLEHEHASLALAQRCSGVQDGTPLFNTLLNYRHNASLRTQYETMSGIESFGGQERTNYPFVMSVEDFGDALGLTAQIVQPFDPKRICGYMQQALESLVEALEQTPEKSVRMLEILPETERRLLLENWNATATIYPDQLCIHQLFEQQVEKTPAATALIAGDETLSYVELNTRANRLARQLIAQGICPNNHVALLLERSIELVVAQLAILKVGAVYVPIDPNVPDERKNWLINDCSAKLLLTNGWVDIPVGLAVPLFRLTDEAGTSREEDSNLDWSGRSSDPAYVMYTSGSTGMPKGVVVPHRAVVRLVINNGYVEIKQDDRVSFTANPAFDASTFEVWAPLLNGGALVVIDYATLLTPQALVRVLQAYRVTILWLTIGLFNRLVTELSPVLPQIKILIFGGDIPDLRVIAEVLDNSPPQQLLQAYGPSEGTTFTTMYRIVALPPGAARVPIGRPIANTCVYLLDDDSQPVPLGVAGEIYVGGDGVACGYLNRQELTAERFLTDPFSGIPNARMYRTGDLARYLPDGNLEFLGRNDQQVKIRGFRIEPGEIEARLTEHFAVREAAVLALSNGQDKQLIAYVVADAEDGLVNSLRTYLNTILPDYMVPTAFVRLDAFPLTANGKLDRRALPMPNEGGFARQIYEAPQGEIEITLVAIWRELLGVEQISRHDNFFALGGHSLLAMRMINLAAGHDLVCTLNDLFQFPVLVELAAKMASDWLSQPRNNAIPVRPDGTGLPLFFVPSGMGDYSYVFGLAQHIQSGYPIYALPWPSISEKPMPTMEQQATRMIILMKAVQPEGPYRICGYSSGGILAYAIAQQLLDAGETINFLGVIDTPAPYYSRKQIIPPKLQFFIELARHLGEERIEELAALYRKIDELSLVQFITAAQELALYPLNLSPNLIARRWEQIENYAQIVRDYEPQVLTVSLHQFYAMEPSPPVPLVMDDNPRPLSMEPSLGWSQIVPAPLLRLIPIPGNHFSLLEDSEDKVVLIRALSMELTISCDGEVQ